MYAESCPQHSFTTIVPYCFSNASGPIVLQVRTPVSESIVAVTKMSVSNEATDQTKAFSPHAHVSCPYWLAVMSKVPSAPQGPTAVSLVAFTTILQSTTHSHAAGVGVGVGPGDGAF